MLHSKNIKMGLFLTILTLSLLFVFSSGLIFSNGAATGSTTPSPVTQPTATSASACAPSFELPEGMSFLNSEGGACKAMPTAIPARELMGKPHRHGYCRCSCGYACQTSADCGGVSCDPFITCC